MISTPYTITRKYQKNQIADHDVAYFVIESGNGTTFTIDV